ncbi:MAG TPA: response regulator, partial [Lutibacter sp.]|nr:response regulator [Lutibacter sp.]
ETLLSLMVAAFSSETIIAKNGIEAVEICRNHPDIDLILMDVKMPELNGYESTRQIRKFNKDIIIIAQTAYGLSSEKEKAINAGCNDYIAKPIKVEAIIALLQKYFNK